LRLNLFGALAGCESGAVDGVFSVLKQEVLLGHEKLPCSNLTISNIIFTTGYAGCNKNPPLSRWKCTDIQGTIWGNPLADILDFTKLKHQRGLNRHAGRHAFLRGLGSSSQPFKLSVLANM